MADDDVFSDETINRLAQTAKLPSVADLRLFGEFVRTAATMYRQSANEAASARIRADVEAIRRTVKPINKRKKSPRPPSIFSALDKAAPETIHLLNRRAKRRGEVFPTADDINDPARMENAARILDTLTRAGGSVMEGRMRPGGNKSKKYVVELYAPVSPRNFAKRKAERIAVVQLRVAWRWAAARSDEAAERAMPANIPATCASHERPGPFVKLVRDFFKELRVNLNAVHVINSIDFKRPMATRD